MTDRAHAKEDGNGSVSASPISGDESQRYVFGDERARGGLGRILEARDTRLNRLVAVKELLKGEKDAQLRFVREALITARLQHPSIVPIHDFGMNVDGKPFYAMKMISGRPLSEIIPERKTLIDRLALLPNLIAVSEAVAYAHEQGVIHRDLKPSNVLIGAFGETVVIDWGLAVDLRASTSPDETAATLPGPEPADLTVAGTIMGTPPYMPPEQARGYRVNERADVYATGAMLYHLISGGPPYKGDSRSEIIEKVIEGKLEPLETRQPNAPKDLVAIVRKAMAPLQGNRYATAKELAEDLRRFQSGRLVAAHSYSPWLLLRRWIRKHRVALTVALLFSLILAVVATVSLRRILREKAVAQQERALAQQRQNETVLIRATNALRTDPTSTIAWLKHYPPDGSNWLAARDLSIAAVYSGVAKQVILSSSWQAISPDGKLLATGGAVPVVIRDIASGRILKELDDAARVWFSPDSKRVLLNGVGSSAMKVVNIESNEVRKLEGHDGEIYGAEFSSDGKWIVSAGADNTVRRWSTSSDLQQIIASDAVLEWLSVSPTRTRFAVGYEDGTVKLFDFSGNSSIVYRGAQADVTPGAFSVDGGYLAVSGGDGSIALLDIPRNQRTILKGTNAVARSLSFSSDSKLLASADGDGLVRIWNIETGASKSLRGQGNVSRVAFSPKDRTLAASDAEDSTITLWDASTGESLQTFRGHKGTVTGLSFSPDGQKLISTSGADSVTRIWQVSAKTGQVFSGHTSTVHDLVWSPRGNLFATASRDATIRLWKTSSTGSSSVWPGQQGQVLKLAFSPDGSSLASGGLDGTVRLWNIATETSHLVQEHKEFLWDVQFSREGKLLGSASNDGTIGIVDLSSGESTALRGQEGPVRSLSFSPDGKSLASGGDQTVWLWDLQTRQGRPLGKHDGLVNRVAFSPGGQSVATGSSDGTIGIWGISTGQKEIQPAHSGSVMAIAFSPDGKQLASAAQDGSARVWELQSKRNYPLVGHDAAVWDIAFSPDGKLIASASVDRTVRVWDAAGGQLVAVYRHKDAVRRVAFSPDGKWLASASLDQTARLWSVESRISIPKTARGLLAWFQTLTNLE